MNNLNVLNKKHSINLSIIICSVFVLQISSLYSQKTNEVETEKSKKEIEEELYRLVDKMPSYKGGEVAMSRFINKKLDIPRSVFNAFKGRTVFVNFIVEKDGSITEVKLLKGVTAIIDEEVVRVIKLMPKWNPGVLKGEYVRVSFNLPVKIG